MAVRIDMDRLLRSIAQAISERYAGPRLVEPPGDIEGGDLPPEVRAWVDMQDDLHCECDMDGCDWPAEARVWAERLSGGMPRRMEFALCRRHAGVEDA